MASKGKKKTEWEGSSYGDKESGSVYLSKDLRKRAEDAAEARKWSFSNLVEHLLEKFLAEPGS